MADAFGTGMPGGMAGGIDVEQARNIVKIVGITANHILRIGNPGGFLRPHVRRVRQRVLAIAGHINPGWGTHIVKTGARREKARQVPQRRRQRLGSASGGNRRGPRFWRAFPGMERFVRLALLDENSSNRCPITQRSRNPHATTVLCQVVLAARRPVCQLVYQHFSRSFFHFIAQVGHHAVERRLSQQLGLARFTFQMMGLTAESNQSEQRDGQQRQQTNQTNHHHQRHARWLSVAFTKNEWRTDHGSGLTVGREQTP